MMYPVIRDSLVWSIDHVTLMASVLTPVAVMFQSCFKGAVDDQKIGIGMHLYVRHEQKA